MNTTTYDEAATTPGAHFPGFRLPYRMGLSEAVACLADLCTEDMAVSAVVQERHGYADRAALIRDPSATHGAPDIDAFRAMLSTLSGPHGWHPIPGAGPAQRLVAMLGRREGYDPAARVHTRGDVARHLYDVPGTGEALIVDVHVMSARYLDGERRIYQEPGVLIGGPTSILPAVTATAATLGQHRFVVIDRDQKRTYALRRR
ncbi:hypothetical protein [Amycolatopsis keratiniphila]|uniref:hypothetical protein n=1 Tax=Amycolatopsis keratiniphila TaxID=129921 RepID=UPI00087BA42C|nr:hypothetical protein [Amycolatopsis keratiniphila]OLZ56096.1 hypothetical protein BS330_18380 [Amycolatopsis keratiniphila subsp. nogabecina]SDU51764.1 hypothetical protein SAMN04489733_5340 [Amycolatopsis keratiniphila]